MIICVEGLDGVGKSELVNNLSKRLNMPIKEKPIKSLYCLSDEKSSEITEILYTKYSSNIRALYYLTGYLSALEDGRKQDYILDRSMLSTYYFSYCEENKALFDFFANNYGHPDLTIILYASIDERINRIKNRNKNDLDLKKERIYKDDYSRYFDAITKYNIPYLLINTERINPNEVLELTIKLIDMWNKNIESRSYIQNIFNIDNIEQIGNYSYSELLNLLDKELEKKLTLKRGK